MEFSSRVFQKRKENKLLNFEIYILKLCHFFFFSVCILPDTFFMINVINLLLLRLQ